MYSYYEFFVFLDGNIRVLVNSSLYIASMREDYYAEYRCWARNDAGPSEAIVFIVKPGKS